MTIAQRLADAGIEVKPLEFEEARAGIWSSGMVLGGEYRITLTGGKGFQVSRGMLAIPDNQTWFATFAGADFAAQSDYTTRIHKVLQEKP